MERQYLVMIQFNINVPSSVYAKYYFSLRTLAEANDLTFPAETLSKERAQKLEAMSRICEDKYAAQLGRNGHKKWSSLDNINAASRRSVAILSWSRPNLRCGREAWAPPSTPGSMSGQARSGRAGTQISLSCVLDCDATGGGDNIL